MFFLIYLFAFSVFQIMNKVLLYINQSSIAVPKNNKITRKTGVRIPLRRGVLDTTLCDKVCQ
jgi:uncharacterized membrane protein